MRPLRLTALLLISLFICQDAQAQYFGRNKASYEKFDFEVYQTPNFEIYHYLNNEDYLNEIANYTERWYKMHQHVLLDTFATKNPLILYNDHADFQQTNAIRGQIGVGTGGVTEAFKNRVIFPLAMSNQQTIHVLGHELVHAFQYNMIIRGDSTNLNNLSNLPLWMVEGLAEYMSKGGVDANTAMWMRDAVMHDDVPSLKDLQNPKYFPYRYGQAFWAFLTGLKGDDIIQPFFTATARMGLNSASMFILGMSQENLSELWTQSIKKQFGPYVPNKKENYIGKKLISDENAGRLNISPSISPNGRYVIFLSEKDLFTIDIFLAEASSGKIIRKVASTLRDGHIDDFSYIESAGTWSPRSDQFAFVGISKGKNKLIIKDVNSGKTVKETAIEGVPAFTNPTWSPNGNSIVVSGLVNGQVDLFAYNIRTGRVERLTNDKYSETLPSWSADGNYLIYSTDQLAWQRGRTNGRLAFNLARMDMSNGSAEMIDVFPGADNMNPLFDTEGNIYFLSDRDGMRNAYKYNPNSGELFQITDYQTGISGITAYAPAMSMDRRQNYLVYSHYLRSGYTIYRARQSDLLTKAVDPNDVNFAAAQLPRVNPKAPIVVDDQIQNIDHMSLLPNTAFTEVEYQPKFKLDYVGGGAGVGVGTSNAFGTTTGMAGAVELLFSDILGNNQLYTGVAMNGEIYDFGAAVTYVNQKNRFGYGATVSHVPYRSTFYAGESLDTLQFQDFSVLANKVTFEQYRQFEDRINGFIQYPFSQTTRLEAGASFSRYYYRIEQIDNYYDAFDPFYSRLIYQERNKLDAPPGFSLFNVGTAFVSDNSYFGLTAPLAGYRLRIGMEKYFGEFNFYSPTIDLRYYQRLKPVTLAVRAMHYGRYGETGDNRLRPLYMGYPWFIRGYEYNSAQNIGLQNPERSVNELFGDKLIVTNFEVRLPFSGPKQLALIKSGLFLTDLNFFVDGGLAFNEFSQVSFNPKEGIPGVDTFQPFFSTGASLRVNLFGALILEPYFAKPLLKNSDWVFGLNFMPGW